MDGLYAIGVLIAFYGGIVLIAWLIEQCQKFLETRRYKRKLERLAPQIETINTDELSSRLSVLQSSHLSLTKLIHGRYRICERREGSESVDQYVQKEAKYRRMRRKPARHRPRRRYRRYY